MEKEFVPYQEALALKELGFDEEYIALYDIDTNELCIGDVDEFEFIHHSFISAPLKQQVFRWFREKYNLKSCIIFRTSMEDNKEYYDWLIKGQEVVYRHFTTYEQAELACLQKLIELVKK
jgi:hypothetical protein